MTHEIDDIENRCICYTCIGEPFLREKVQKEGTKKRCSYCAKTGNSLSIEEIADEIEGAFERHYHRTPTGPDDFEYMMLKEGGDWEREGDPVIDAIASAAKIDNLPATDIQEILGERHSDLESAQMGEECEFDADSFYTDKGPDDVDFRIGWSKFERGIKNEARFFSKTAEANLADIFEGLNEHQTHDNKPIIVEAGPENFFSSLYRARVFQSYEILEKALERPDIEIGPPPPEAASAGRMNARGISVFYGATDPDLALAEVRPPVGSRVIVGRFELIRPIKLLDVDALRSIYVQGSIFDSGHIRRLERARFLERLSQKMTMPVMPNDEPMSYLVTQAVADYLATRCNLDGIIYPSVQANNGKLNAVLFHHAAKVEHIDLPKGTELRASTYTSTEDGPEDDYSIWEEVPVATSSVKPVEPPTLLSPPYPRGNLSEFDDSDYRNPTLRIDLPSVTVHHIDSIAIRTTPYPVRRHRSEKRERKF